MYVIVKRAGIEPSKQMYNGIILAHAKRGEAIEAEKVLREMKEQGLVPD